MRQPPRKQFEAIRSDLEAVEEEVEQLFKRLEAVKPGPGEAKALLERLKQGPPSASDRQRLLEILAAEEAALEFLLTWPPPGLPRSRLQHARRSKQRRKRDGRQRRRK
jgi:Arc/MetJ-type ribon-helix-helix transcriptional regulator